MTSNLTWYIVRSMDGLCTSRMMDLNHLLYGLSKQKCPKILTFYAINVHYVYDAQVAAVCELPVPENVSQVC